ncbi:MAG: hypothetical protein A2516_04040 [Alphaproteobacteria bacterium RIFOXYD12_FULL_60_8]|nr:MAG: hypothetical protein A2516_04040 [Alphaproteobacteria bacterium RIFOXYD12_FULL_60_8]
MQLITFKIGNSLYGVDIMAVHEIRVWTETKSLPNTPAYVRGVINLRGVIVPIFDLRDRFGQGATQPTSKHVVIVVTVERRTIGLLVDSVSDILTINTTEIRPVPEGDAGSDYAFVLGLVAVEEDMVSLIAPGRLFSEQAINAISS